MARGEAESSFMSPKVFPGSSPPAVQKKAVFFAERLFWVRKVLTAGAMLEAQTGEPIMIKSNSNGLVESGFIWVRILFIASLPPPRYPKGPERFFKSINSIEGQESFWAKNKATFFVVPVRE